MAENKISARELRDHQADIINRVLYTKEEVVIVRRNKPIAVIVPYTGDQERKDD